MRKLRRPAGGLWNNADFLKLWTGQSISEFGSQVSQLAIAQEKYLDRTPACFHAKVDSH